MDPELRHYLELLMEHDCKLNRETCPECRSLQRIYEFMMAEIFTTVVYPETALELRHGKAETEHANRATAFPHRPHS